MFLTAKESDQRDHSHVLIFVERHILHFIDDYLVYSKHVIVILLRILFCSRFCSSTCIRYRWGSPPRFPLSALLPEENGDKNEISFLPCILSFLSFPHSVLLGKCTRFPVLWFENSREASFVRWKVLRVFYYNDVLFSATPFIIIIL